MSARYRIVDRTCRALERVWARDRDVDIRRAGTLHGSDAYEAGVHAGTAVIGRTGHRRSAVAVATPTTEALVGLWASDRGAVEQ